MRVRWAAALSAGSCCAIAGASVTLSVDAVDASDGITLPPAGVFVADVLADVSADDAWIVGGFRGVTFNGAAFRYCVDPNNLSCFYVNVGTQNRFVNLISRPQPRDADGRFNTSGAATAGRYCPTGPSSEFTPDNFNVAYFASPPATPGSPSEDGAVLRIGLDLPPGVDASDCVAVPLGQEPPGAIPLMISACENGRPGTVSATYDEPTLVGLDWGVFVVPEPAGVVTVVVGAMLVLLRRG